MIDEALRRAIEAMQTLRPAGPAPEPGDYVELADENDPDGWVVLRRANGQAVMWMPRATFEALRDATLT